jgi:signal peptidase
MALDRTKGGPTMNQNIGKTIRNVFFYVIALVLLMYITIQVVAPDFTIKVFRFKPYVVLTDSMEPYIDSNDLVIVKYFKIEDLDEDDIVTFYADVNYDGETEIVTHYVYSITNNSGVYTIRTNRHFTNETEITPDPWVLSEEDILGVYSFHVPLIGSIALFLRSPFGIAAVVVNIGVIGGIIYIVKTTPKETEKKEEIEEKSDN